MDIKVQLPDSQVRTALSRLLSAGQNLSPAMRVVAGHLAAGVEDAFASETAPDGTPWATLAPATEKARAKTGHTPITILQQQGDLARSLVEAHDSKSAQVSTGLEYAAAHQFGIEERNLPARPYLGLSDTTQTNIRTSIIAFIAEQWLDSPPATPPRMRPHDCAPPQSCVMHACWHAPVGRCCP